MRTTSCACVPYMCAITMCGPHACGLCSMPVHPVCVAYECAPCTTQVCASCITHAYAPCGGLCTVHVCMKPMHTRLSAATLCPSDATNPLPPCLFPQSELPHGCKVPTRVRVRVLTLVTMLMHQACEKIYYKKLLLLHEYGKNMSEKNKGK